MIVTKTERLILREFSLQDAEGFYRLNADLEVMRYTGDTSFESEQASAAFIDAYCEYRLHGFGRWSLLDRETGEYIGFCGLRRDPVTQEVDLGFRLLRSVWGKGFASEAACAALKIGVERYNVTDYVANVMRENLASIALIQKLGFTQTEQQDVDSLWLRFVLAY
ncbi:N-acetyltransferase [Shewanella hanedai]|uniref:GNAT family N-acetyltransferase n=1 Tax=Shewanella hanedai TaxID=25 RepID=A0A553JMT8_SHEHA|nr:GNAT family N-acetyltransferase [Shewanella hanedai]TRY13731.1 GNAT family N-acetyltransferase [Shewanella hanedai]GGI87100.1 N-acetyltransferase [Shewanella hanedai]